MDENRLDRLITTRDQLAAALAGEPSARDLPSISREYRMVLAEIAGLDDVKEKPDVVDQLSARRGAKGSRRARRSS